MQKAEKSLQNNLFVNKLHILFTNINRQIKYNHTLRQRQDMERRDYLSIDTWQEISQESLPMCGTFITLSPLQTTYQL